MSEARFWSDVLCCVADGRWNMVAVFTSWQDQGELVSGWLIDLEKAMATHSSILAWRIPWMEEPGGLQSMGSNELDMTEQLHFHWLIDYQENQLRGMPLFDKLSWQRCSDLKIRTVTSQGQGQVCRNIIQVSSMQVKQLLVEQGMYRKQKNSHFG